MADEQSIPLEVEGALGPPPDEPTWDDGESLIVPISAIEHFSYCPRQFALIHIEQIFEENVFTVRGHLDHERVDSGDDTPARGIPVQRALPLWSARYGLSGRCDLVEFRPEGPYPVEYKSGHRRGIHADLQLCAQALCLEEMLDAAVTHGAIYYIGARSRCEVLLDATLRSQTLTALEQIRALLRDQAVPAPVNDARCRNCSLRDVCLPDIVADRAHLRGLQSSLYVAPEGLGAEE